jgi:hypothetical protein
MDFHLDVRPYFCMRRLHIFGDFMNISYIVVGLLTSVFSMAHASCGQSQNSLPYRCILSYAESTNIQRVHFSKAFTCGDLAKLVTGRLFLNWNGPIGLADKLCDLCSIDHGELVLIASPFSFTSDQLASEQSSLTDVDYLANVRASFDQRYTWEGMRLSDLIWTRSEASGRRLVAPPSPEDQSSSPSQWGSTVISEKGDSPNTDALPFNW